MAYQARLSGSRGQDGEDIWDAANSTDTESMTEQRATEEEKNLRSGRRGSFRDRVAVEVEARQDGGSPERRDAAEPAA
jgi:hypothetical protein